MNIAIHFNGCAKVKNDSIWIRGQFGYFVDEIAKKVNSIDLLLDDLPNYSSDNMEFKTDYCLKSNNVNHISLGCSGGGITTFVGRLRGIKNALKNTDYDFVIMREPSRRSPYIRYFLSGTPIVFLFGGDWVNQLESPGLSMAKIRATLYTKSLKKAIKSSLVFVNNEELLNKWERFAPDIFLTRTSSFKNSHIIDNPKIRFESNKIIKILYVGRLDPLKGLESLFHAVSVANNSLKSKFTLDIIGSGDQGYTMKLSNLTSILGIEAKVNFLGYIDFESVFKYYRTADVLVLPTLAENISRTIWEAMASGCPVITTPVGGQKYAFEEKKDLLFFEPNDSDDLFRKLMLLVNNQKLVRRLSESGVETARNNTVEKRVDEMLNIVLIWKGKKNESL
jgi:glycosyltransferase involved in cell wall biosynthesis